MGGNGDLHPINTGVNCDVCDDVMALGFSSLGRFKIGRLTMTKGITVFISNN